MPMCRSSCPQEAPAHMWGFSHPMTAPHKPTDTLAHFCVNSARATLPLSSSCLPHPRLCSAFRALAAFSATDHPGFPNPAPGRGARHAHLRLFN